MTFSIFLVTQPFATDGATSLSSAEKATELTESQWPLSVCSGAPVAASQSLTVRSSEPDATSLPSAEKATEVTRLQWPSSVCSGAPVAASQSLTVQSSEPDATSLPSAEKATEVTPPE